jgi:hypothetical protein
MTEITLIHILNKMEINNDKTFYYNNNDMLL